MGKNIIDVFFGLALIFNAILFIPQAIRIYKTKNIESNSLITFAGFNFIQILGFINGIYHNDYALIIGQAISFITCGLVTLQIIIYRKKNKVTL